MVLLEFAKKIKDIYETKMSEKYKLDGPKTHTPGEVFFNIIQSYKDFENVFGEFDVHLERLEKDHRGWSWVDVIVRGRLVRADNSLSGSEHKLIGTPKSLTVTVATNGGENTVLKKISEVEKLLLGDLK